MTFVEKGRGRGRGEKISKRGRKIGFLRWGEERETKKKWERRKKGLGFFFMMGWFRYFEEKNLECMCV